MSLTFERVTAVGQPLFTRSVEVNLVEWTKWALLSIGSYVNINQATPAIPSTTNSPKTLFLFDVPGITKGRVWAGRRSNWIWETVSRLNPPTPVAVYIGGVLQDPSTYKIDYPQGFIIFNSVVASTSVVTANYSYRYHQVYDSSNPFFYKADFDSLTNDDARWGIAPGEGGELEILPKSRIQFPSIYIRPAGNFRGVPYEMGSTAHDASLDFAVTCLAETKPELTWMSDVFCHQQGVSPSTFNLATAPPPLNESGMTNTSPQTYPSLCQNFPWTTFTIDGARTTIHENIGSLCYSTVILSVRTGVLG